MCIRDRLQWIDLLDTSLVRKLAHQRILASYSAKDIDQEAFIRLSTRGRAEQECAKAIFEADKKNVPAQLLCALLDDERCQYRMRQNAVRELSERKGSEISIDWVKGALDRSSLSSSVSQFLRNGMYSGEELGIDWPKSLLNRRAHRELAFDVLSNRKLVSPIELGVPWLLRLAARDDQPVSYTHLTLPTICSV